MHIAQRCVLPVSFTTMAVMNPPEKKLEKRTSVHWDKFVSEKIFVKKICECFCENTRIIGFLITYLPTLGPCPILSDFAWPLKKSDIINEWSLTSSWFGHKFSSHATKVLSFESTLLQTRPYHEFIKNYYLAHFLLFSHWSCLLPVSFV